MQPPPPLLVSQRRRIWGATDARDAPRRASLPTHAAAGEGPSGSPAAEDPVLLGVSDGYMPLKGVIQVERPGQTDAQSKLVNFIIRPPRTDYSPNDDLWEQEFMLKGRWFQRKDLEVQF